MVATCASFDDYGRMYVREIQRTRNESVLDFVHTLWRMCKRWRPLRVAVETVVFQELIYRDYQRTAVNEGWDIPWGQIKRRGMKTKSQRIRGLQPRVERGDFFVVDPLPEWEALETELMFFPKPPHDDILDTLADLEEIFFASPAVDTDEPEADYGTFEEVGRWLDGVGSVESTSNPILRW